MEIGTAEVPRIIKDELPWFSQLAAEYINDLWDAASYPLLGALVPRVISQANSRDPQDAERVAKFFDVVEQIYGNCHPGTVDLFALENLGTDD